MRCLQCDYLLWNLEARTCPECGTDFAPSQYDFLPNSVRFICPGCRQEYFGTSARGHLEPSSFQCVSCGRALAMDEMILAPAAGDVDPTTDWGVPWLQRQRYGFMKSWWQTVARSFTKAGPMMAGLPDRSGWLPAWSFLITTTFIAMVGAMAPMVLFIGVMAVGAGGGGPGLGPLSIIMASGVAFGLVLTPILTLLWALVAHLVLRMGGPVRGGVRRTFQSICYASGVQLLNAVPCVGGYVGPVWWIVSGILAVRSSQAVSGLRASVAVLIGPVLMVVVAVTGYIIMLAAMLPSISSARAAAATAAGQLNTTAAAATAAEFHAALQEHARANGTLPKHALSLLTSTQLSPGDFAVPGTTTYMAPRVAPPLSPSLGDITLLSQNDLADFVAAAEAGQPLNVVAHRVGDWVFTYHGINLNDPAAGQLWIAVCAPTAVMGGGWASPMVVVLADGTVTEYSPATIGAALSNQNDLRVEAGLAPIPPPLKINAGTPVAPPQQGPE